MSDELMNTPKRLTGLAEVQETIAELARLQDENGRMRERFAHHDLYVDALAEIKASVDGKSDQTVRAIIAGLLSEVAYRLEAEHPANVPSHVPKQVDAEGEV